jgi:hypothetical protein
MKDVSRLSDLCWQMEAAIRGLKGANQAFSVLLQRRTDLSEEQILAMFFGSKEMARMAWDFGMAIPRDPDWVAEKPLSPIIETAVSVKRGRLSEKLAKGVYEGVEGVEMGASLLVQVVQLPYWMTWIEMREWARSTYQGSIAPSHLAEDLKEALEGRIPPSRPILFTGAGWRNSALGECSPWAEFYATLVQDPESNRVKVGIIGSMDLGFGKGPCDRTDYANNLLVPIIRD